MPEDAAKQKAELDRAQALRDITQRFETEAQAMTSAVAEAATPKKGGLNVELPAYRVGADVLGLRVAAGATATSQPIFWNTWSANECFP